MSSTTPFQLPRNIDVALATLRQDDAVYRRAAINMLREAGAVARHAAIPLAEMAQHTLDPDRLEHIAFALYSIREHATPALSELITLLAQEETDSYVRTLYLGSLQAIGSKAAPARETVCVCLGATDPYLRTEAARTLGAIGNLTSAQLSQLAEVASHDDDDQVREAALVALYRVTTPDKSRLSQLDVPPEWASVVAGLAGLCDRGAVLTHASQADALTDPNPCVREAAAMVLAELGISNDFDPPEIPAAPALAQCLADPDPRVRIRAADALEWYRDELLWLTPMTIQPLLAAVNDAADSVKVTAMYVLINAASNPELAVLISLHLPQIRRLLESPSDHVRGAATGLLGALGTGASEALPDLVQLAGTPQDSEGEDDEVSLDPDHNTAFRSLRMIQACYREPQADRAFTILNNKITFAPGISFGNVAYAVAAGLSEVTDLGISPDDLESSGGQLDLDEGMRVSWSVKNQHDKPFELKLKLILDEDELSIVTEICAYGESGRGGELYYRESITVLDADAYRLERRNESPYDMGRPLFFIALNDALGRKRAQNPLDGPNTLPEVLPDLLANVFDDGSRAVVIADISTDESLRRALAALAILGKGSIACLWTESARAPDWLKARGVQQMLPGTLHVLRGKKTPPLLWAVPSDVRRELAESDDVLSGDIFGILSAPALKSWCCEMTTLVSPYFDAHVRPVD